MKTCYAKAQELGEQLKQQGLKLAVAESCTGGLLAASLTDVSGSSAWFDRGFVTYSNQAKHEMLGVSEHTLNIDGAVSETTVRAMAEGAILHSNAHLSVAISGIAGPTGGTSDKPVGTVWLAWAGARQPTHAACYTFSGDRDDIRKATVLEALVGLIKRMSTYDTPSSTQHYFFALFPDDATSTALHQEINLLTEQTTCRPAAPHQLHLTLAYLGALSPKACIQVKQIINACPVAPFELALEAICHMPKHQLIYAQPKLSASLKQLYDFLNQTLLKQGFKPERRPYLPHITLARDYEKVFNTSPIKTITWFVHDVYLMQSEPQRTSSDYTVIQRSPLKLT